MSDRKTKDQMGECRGSRHQKYKRGLFNDAYDREQWKGFMMAAMVFNGPTS